MSVPVQLPVAWEPFTPRGVAAFAHARLSRLLVVQFVIASLAAVAVVGFFSNDIFPVVNTAIGNLPATGAIRDGRLDWPGKSPQLLSEGRYVAFIVDPGHTSQIRSTAHVQIEFGRDTARFYSLLGYAEFKYPSDWIIAFNRTDLEPLWGAWEPECLAILIPAVVVGLMLCWAALATAYFLPAWLLGFMANRHLNLRAAWKMSGAALLPGALLLTAGAVLYSLDGLEPMQLGFLFSVHLVLGWIYLFISQLFLPRMDEVPRGNPFSLTS